MWGEAIGAVAGGLANRLFSSKPSMKNAWETAKIQGYQTSQHLPNLIKGAKEAGIHPLAALGSSVPSFSGGATVGGSDSGMGQDIGRAITAGLTGRSRQEARMNELALERGQLENDLLRSQIAKESSSQVAPALPSPTDRNGAFSGQGDAFNLIPSQSTASNSGRPETQAGAINSYQYAATPGGGYSIVRSKDMTERLEDDPLGTAEWHIRNRIIPMRKGLTPPDPKQYPLPKGATHWVWSRFGQEFVPAYPRPQKTRGLMRRFNLK